MRSCSASSLTDGGGSTLRRSSAAVSARRPEARPPAAGGHDGHYTHVSSPSAPSPGLSVLAQPCRCHVEHLLHAASRNGGGRKHDRQHVARADRRHRARRIRRRFPNGPRASNSAGRPSSGRHPCGSRRRRRPRGPGAIRAAVRAGRRRTGRTAAAPRASTSCTRRRPVLTRGSGSPRRHPPEERLRRRPRLRRRRCRRCDRGPRGFDAGSLSCPRALGRHGQRSVRARGQAPATSNRAADGPQPDGPRERRGNRYGAAMCPARARALDAAADDVMPPRPRGPSRHRWSAARRAPPVSIGACTQRRRRRARRKAVPSASRTACPRSKPAATGQAGLDGQHERPALKRPRGPSVLRVPRER